MVLPWGEVREEGTFIKGKREGKIVEYYLVGQVKDVDIYNEGECVEMCLGDA